MPSIYRFSTKYITNPGVYLFNKQMHLRAKISPHQVQTGMWELASLFATMETKKAGIESELKKYSDDILQQATGSSLVASNLAVTVGNKIATNLLVAPQMKLYSFNNYALSISEEQDIGGLFHRPAHPQSAADG